MVTVIMVMIRQEEIGWDRSYLPAADPDAMGHRLVEKARSVGMDDTTGQLVGLRAPGG